MSWQLEPGDAATWFRLGANDEAVPLEHPEVVVEAVRRIAKTVGNLDDRRRPEDLEDVDNGRPHGGGQGLHLLEITDIKGAGSAH